jgi:hypothetical protein
MNTELETISPDWVGDQLLDLGIVSSLSGVHLQPLRRNSERLDYVTRQAFRLWSGRKTVCFLLIGPGLENLWRRARAFSRACPNIATKPLFLQRTIRTDFLGLEFVGGGTLEEAVATGRLSVAESGNAALAVLSALENTFRDSTAAAAHAELKQFFASVLSCPIFGNIDSGFLRDVIFPWVRSGAIAQPARTRWTNGDLVAQNIVFDEQGSPRLVDYEFAQRTHFFSEDVLRWRRYSEVNKDVFDHTFPSAQPWAEAYFLLRQTVLESQIANPQLSLDGANERVRRLRELASDANSQFRASLFLKPLAQSLLDESEAERARLGAALSAQQARIQELDAEIVKRGEWGLGLQASLDTANKRASEMAEIEKQRDAATQQITNLTADLTQAKAHSSAVEERLAASQDALLEKTREAANLSAISQKSASMEEDLRLLEEKLKEAQAVTVRSMGEAAGAPKRNDAMCAELRNEIEIRDQRGRRLEEELTDLKRELAASQTALAVMTKNEADRSAALALAQSAEHVLRQRLAGVEEDLRNNEEHLAKAQAIVLQSMGEISDLSTRGRWLEDKVQRMQNSFSWKSTAVLRAFRRLFLTK